MRDFSHIKHLIVKVGSSSLCDEKGNIDSQRILGLVQQIAHIRQRGIQVTLVSSGAISAGMKAMNLRKKPETIPEKQALAAIGQASLMKIYEDMFHIFHMKSAQILMNHDDFDDRKRLLNFYHAMQSLIKYKVVPIINENDTLAVDEIKVGDNDTMAALVVPIVNADLVVLISDIDGLYDKNPHIYKDAQLIEEVDEVNHEIESMASDTDTQMGTGGMVTKLRAAKICTEYGCDMAIVNGQSPHVLLDLLDGKPVGTLFHGDVGRNLNARQLWIMYQTWSKGCIIVDAGCAKALRHHKSLLPSGITGVSGDFSMSSIVDIIDENGVKLAKGISNYSSKEIDKIKGKKTSAIESILGEHDYDEVVHANNMVLVKRSEKHD